jgi:hypothetical protein
MHDHLKATAMRVLPFYDDSYTAVHQAGLVHSEPLTDAQIRVYAEEVAALAQSFRTGEWAKLLTADELDAMIAGFDKLQLGDATSVVGLFLATSAQREESRRVSLDLPVTYEHSGRTT